MKKRIGPAFRLAALLLALLFLCGCWNSRELSQLAVMMGIGIDQSPIDAKHMELTVQLAKPTSFQSEGGGGGEELPYWNLTYTDTDIFYGLREMSHQVSRKIYIPHNQFILFGEDFARGGLQRSLDFFMRDHESRMEVLVMMARGKAADILAVKPQLEQVPAIGLVELMHNQKANSHTLEVRLLDFVDQMVSETSTAMMPIVDLSENDEEPKVMLRGMAVFKTDKYVGDLDARQTRGMMWVNNKIKSGAIEVQSPGGQVVVEIIKAKSKVTPVVKEDGSIVMQIKVRHDGSLASQQGTQNLSDKQGILLLNREVKQAILDEMEAALLRSYELKADIFGFGETLRKKYPKLWKSLSNNWDEVYPTIKVEVDIDTRIISTGRLTAPAKPELE